MKIMTLTLNPAIDKSTSTDKLEPEKKLRCAAPKVEPGGGGVNVSRVLRRLGTDATAVFAAGGPTGLLLGDLLDQEGVPYYPIPTKNWTRESLVVYINSTQQQYRFVMPGPSLDEAECDAFLNYFAENPCDWLIASGSLPPGIPSDFYARLVAITKQHHTKLVVDTSGEALQQALAQGVYLIKPNLHELGMLLGKPNIEHKDQEKAALELIQSGKCQIVVVSLGARGAMLASAEGISYVTPPTVVVRSTVGAGDSMVAGMVWALAQGWKHVDALKYGIACGTATTMNFGTELCHKNDVENIFNILKRGKS